jgi:hypothetical protein
MRGEEEIKVRKIDFISSRERFWQSESLFNFFKYVRNIADMMDFFGIYKFLS